MKAWRPLKIRIAADRSTILAGLTGLFIGSLVGFGLIIWNSRVKPVILYNVHDIDGHVCRDGHIDIAFDIDVPAGHLRFPGA